MKGPEPFIADFLKTVECPVTRRAVTPDSSRRVHVGHDIFYLADAAAVAKFRKDPLAFAGPLTDPVTKERFTPTRKSPHVTHRGRPFYFASGQTVRQFKAMPDSFAIRKGM